MRTAGYAPISTCNYQYLSEYIVKGLNVTFKLFERQLTDDSYGLEFECQKAFSLL